MKLESLKSSKFEAFKENELCDLEKIVGGQRLVMSGHYTNGVKVASDSGDLTKRGGGSYDGQPGDGTAGDWNNVCWSSNSFPIGSDGEGCDNPFDPPYGEEAEFWNALSGDIFTGVIE